MPCRAAPHQRGLDQGLGDAVGCLRHYSTHAVVVWAAFHLCVACHYYQYEIGPTRSQVQAWRAEVSTLASLLGHHDATAMRAPVGNQDPWPRHTDAGAARPATLG